MTDTNEATDHTPIPEAQRRALATVGRAILDGRPITEEMVRHVPARFVNPIKALDQHPLTPAGLAYALAAAADWLYQYSDDLRASSSGRWEKGMAREAITRAGLLLEDVLRDLGVRR